MANLDTAFLIPLKVVNARSVFLKENLKGLIKNVESRAFKKHTDSKKFQDIVSWDDWIYAALDCLNPLWSKNLLVGEEIPQKLLDSLHCSVGELVSLGSWLLTKNIYRFENEVAKELSKSEFKGKLPSYLINIQDICIYVQLDNFKIYFKDSQLVGVIFSINNLNEEKVLISTIFLDTGLTRTIVSIIDENLDIEDCLSDFIDKFHDDKSLIDTKEIEEYQFIQKKLINILLWFSQTEPDYMPLIPENHEERTGFKKIKKDIRLFEASKYKPFQVGLKTKVIIKNLNENFMKLENTNSKRPHLRKAHYHLYWYGKKGAYERHQFKWIPITIVGG